MRVDCYFFATVPMVDAGNAGPRPQERRYGRADFAACYENLEHWATTADRVGYDTMWCTEHHFQYEGYEVVPNGILLGLHLASLTERLHFGQMFNIVPQWHPLRLAEDFAMADILSRGRLRFGVGRGNVPREAQTLGSVVASGDNNMKAEFDRENREIFEEAMEVIVAALTKEQFSFTGKHFVVPPVGIPDRGTTVSTITLVPKPVSPVEIYQAVNSPATIDYVARKGFIGVFSSKGMDRLRANWERFAKTAADAGRELRRGEGRVLVVRTHIGVTHEEALRTARNGHDEACRFLSAYGGFRTYAPPAGVQSVPFDYQPTLEESIRQGIWAVGSIEEVAEMISDYRDQLGLEHICLFFDMPGLTRSQLDEQMIMFADEVAPLLGIRMDHVKGDQCSGEVEQ